MHPALSVIFFTAASGAGYGLLAWAAAAALTGAMPARVQSRVSYYIELTKPRILVMILLTVVIAMVSGTETVSLVKLLLLGGIIGCVIGLKVLH